MDKDAPERWFELLDDLSARQREQLKNAIDAHKDRTLRQAADRAVRALFRESDARAYEAPIPLKRWATWARQPKQTVTDRSELLGLPVRGGVSLVDFVAALYRFIDDNMEAIAKRNDPKFTNGSPVSPFLELLRQERWRSARLARMRQESQVVSASFMRDAMQVVVAMLTQAGTKLYDLHGEAAYQILEDAAGAIGKKVDDMFAKGIEEDAAAADAEATDVDPDDEGM